ncbi:MAG: hypothetical protein M9962_05755 [Oligoflexia bacterium]|nr:hypothetical protein [Oligoflexia bacterium]
MQHLLILFSIILISSCAAKSYDQKYVDQYKSRDTLENSLLDKDGNLNESDIEKILTKKIKFPDSISLAIVRIPENSYDSMQIITRSDEMILLNREKWGDRVRTIIPMPQMLLTKTPNLKNLRQAAALLQADALIVIRPVSMVDWKFNVFTSDEAKATSSIEVMLVDIRTSAIPFTALITEQVKIEEQSDDFSKIELLLRAKKQSELKASLQVPQAVKNYLESAL